MNRRNTMDMVHGPLLKNLFLFSIPLMLTSLLQMLFNTADTIMVGRFAGSQALAAVGSTGSIIFLLTGLFNGLSTGSNVVIAKYLGGNDGDKASKAVHTSIMIALLGGVLLTAIGIFFARPILTLMSTPGDIIDLSTLYLQIYFAGILFLFVYNFGAAILRSKGDTKRPLYFLMFSGVLNVILNLAFVVIFHMSVAGVALATVISEAISAILVWYTLLKEEDETHLNVKELKLNMPLMLEIMRIGIPAGIQGIFFSLSNVVIQSTLNSFDSSIIVAGNSAGNNIEQFVYIGMMAFNNAVITFTSQNIGAKNYGAIKRILTTCMALVVSSSIIVSFIAYGFGETLLGFYTSEQGVIDVGMKRLFWVVLFLFLNGILDVFLSSLRGMAVSTLPTIMMLVGIIGVRLSWLWFVFPMYPTVDVIYMCFPVSWTITSIIQGIAWYIVHQRMMKQVVLEID